MSYKFCPQSHLAHLFYTHGSPCRKFLDSLLAFARFHLKDDSLSDEDLYQMLLSAAYDAADLYSVLSLGSESYVQLFHDNHEHIKRLYTMAANRSGNYVHDYLYSVMFLDPNSDDLTVFMDTLSTGQGPSYAMEHLVEGLCYALASAALVDVSSSC